MSPMKTFWDPMRGWWIVTDLELEGLIRLIMKRYAFDGEGIDWDTAWRLLGRMDTEADYLGAQPRD